VISAFLPLKATCRSVMLRDKINFPVHFFNLAAEKLQNLMQDNFLQVGDRLILDVAIVPVSDSAVELCVYDATQIISAFRIKQKEVLIIERGEKLFYLEGVIK